jgi:putative flippase GtrA
LNKEEEVMAKKPSKKLFFSPWLDHQLVKYLLVGLMNTSMSYLLFFLLVTIKVHYQLSLILVTILVICNSYLWHKHWTFRSSDKNMIGEFFRFNSVYFLSLGINSLLLFIFAEKFHIDPRLAQLFCIVISTIVNFLGHRFWSFKRS